MHESLKGRKRVFHLLPFSFLEILNYKNSELCNLIINRKKILPYDHKRILKLFLDYQGKKKAGETEVFFIYPYEIGNYIFL